LPPLSAFSLFVKPVQLSSLVVLVVPNLCIIDIFCYLKAQTDPSERHNVYSFHLFLLVCLYCFLGVLNQLFATPQKTTTTTKIPEEAALKSSRFFFLTLFLFVCFALALCISSRNQPNISQTSLKHALEKHSFLSDLPLLRRTLVFQPFFFVATSSQQRTKSTKSTCKEKKTREKSQHNPDEAYVAPRFTTSYYIKKKKTTSFSFFFLLVYLALRTCAASVPCFKSTLSHISNYCFPRRTGRQLKKQQQQEVCTNEQQVSYP
jgi:nitrate reductase NapE component